VAQLTGFSDRTVNTARREWLQVALFMRLSAGAHGGGNLLPTQKWVPPLAKRWAE
jgi:hypothetical protein